MNNDRLGNILIQQGAIKSDQLDFCLSVQKNNGRQRLGQLLCHYNFANERSIAQAIAAQVGWEVFDGNYEADPSMLSLFGIDFLVERMIFPVKAEEGVVFVLLHTNDTQTTDLIIEKIAKKPVFAVGIDKALRKALENLSAKFSTAEASSLVIEERLSQWFEDCLNQAVIHRASDIHIEPSQKVIEIRFRVDGMLNVSETLPLKCLSRLVNIIFHKADVTISDFGHIHDARFLHKYLNRAIDVRVSHIPSVYGSSIVLRLLDKAKSIMALSELGYSPRVWEFIQEGLIKPDGISLVVGPTGCGKTTTLYAILNSLKNIDCKILTVEDPVEIQLPLMTQVQINEKRDITFSSSVRAFLRHDPDIILIGEIRDQPTAQEALRSAMTGHQVFSTLHTNRAVDAVLRLHDLGLPFSHMADHLSMIVAQRLVRKLCAVCKKSQRVNRAQLSKHQHKYLTEDEQEIFRPLGCKNCRGGYMGQTVVAEVLLINEEIGDFIAQGDFIGFKKSLRENKHPSMIDHARELIFQGITSVEEIQRVLG